MVRPNYTCDRCKRGWERSRYKMGYNKQGMQRTAGPQESKLQCALSKSRSSAPAHRRGRKALVPRTPKRLLSFCLSFLLHNWLRSCSKYHQISRSVGPHRSDTQYWGHFLPLCLVLQSIYESPLLFDKAPEICRPRAESCCQKPARSNLGH